MFFLKALFKILLFLFCTNAYSADSALMPAVTETIAFSELIGHEKYPLQVKELIQKALALSNQNLTYLYGSSDPKNKGMDCSGTIYYLLSQEKIAGVPRQANQLYQWAWQQGHLYPVNSHQIDSFEFEKLKPGDLLFWSGTYSVVRDPDISHVMLYLGKNQQHKMLMWGASDGRTYQGKKMWGVSVFDFILPKADAKSRFVGYSCIPSLTCD